MSIRDEVIASSKKNDKWFTVKEICENCKCSDRTFKNFKAETLRESTFPQSEILHKPSKLGGNLYSEKVLKLFQSWLMKNTINAGGQKTDESFVKQNAMENLEIGMAANKTTWTQDKPLHEEDKFVYTKAQICNLCKCSLRTFETFAPKAVAERDFVSIGASHTKYYTEDVLKRFQIWLSKNQVNQGRGSDVVKQNAMENLEIGMAANAVMSSGSVEAAEQFAKLLISRTKAVKENRRLEEENKTLQIENNSLKIELDESKKWTTLQRYFDSRNWRTDRKELANLSKKLGTMKFTRKKIFSAEYKNGLWSYRTKDLDEYFSEPEF